MKMNNESSESYETTDVSVKESDADFNDII